MFEGLPWLRDVSFSYWKGSLVAIDNGRGFTPSCSGLPLTFSLRQVQESSFPETFCKILEARLPLGSSWMWNIELRLSGEDGDKACLGEAVLPNPRGALSFCSGEPSLFSVVLDVLRDGSRSSKDMDKPLLALRGKCCWILARNECWVCSCGRSLACFRASIGLAARVISPDSSL